MLVLPRSVCWESAQAVGLRTKERRTDDPAEARSPHESTRPPKGRCNPASRERRGSECGDGQRTDVAARAPNMLNPSRNRQLRERLVHSTVRQHRSIDLGRLVRFRLIPSDRARTRTRARCRFCATIPSRVRIAGASTRSWCVVSWIRDEPRRAKCCSIASCRCCTSFE